MAVKWWDKLIGRHPAAPSRTMHRPCFVKFNISDPESLDRLVSVVEALKRDKTAESPRSDEEWRQLFTQGELETFWAPTSEERAQWEKYWFSTPLPKRHSLEMPMPPWHFELMIEMILEHSDYDLLGVRPLSGGEAVLEFEPNAYPYGGTEALRALIRAFGHEVAGADDGSGYEPGDPVPPRWTPTPGVGQ